MSVLKCINPISEFRWIDDDAYKEGNDVSWYFQLYILVKSAKRNMGPLSSYFKERCGIAFQRNMEKALNLDLAFSTTPHLLTPYISRSLSTCMCALDREGRDMDQPWQDRIPNFPYANNSTLQMFSSNSSCHVRGKQQTNLSLHQLTTQKTKGWD
jgi:hypothetical protein